MPPCVVAAILWESWTPRAGVPSSFYFHGTWMSRRGKIASEPWRCLGWTILKPRDKSIWAFPGDESYFEGHSWQGCGRFCFLLAQKLPRKGAFDWRDREPAPGAGQNRGTVQHLVSVIIKVAFVQRHLHGWRGQLSYKMRGFSFPWAMVFRVQKYFKSNLKSLIPSAYYTSKCLSVLGSHVDAGWRKLTR